MPQSSSIVVSAREEEDIPYLWFIFVYSGGGGVGDGKITKKKKISLPCEHRPSAKQPVFICPLVVDGEKLAVSCWECKGIRLLDLQTEKWGPLFENWTGNLCTGDQGRIFVQSRNDDSIDEFSASGLELRGPLKTLQPDIECMAMCYIPPLINALVLSDFYSSKMVAWSVDKDDEIWEFNEEISEISESGDEKGVVRDREGLFFCSKDNVLLVADGWNKRILVVNPEDGSLTQTIDLPTMSHIACCKSV